MSSNKKIIPVLLSGGSGTRLWPLSRRSYPKQFTKLVGDQTLFQQSASRLISSDLLRFDKQITVTNAEFRFVVTEQLQELGIDPGPVILEPEVKNTAPAILAATFYAMQNDPEAILLVLPSDHVIADVNSFHEAISLGLFEADVGNVVTFGVKPTRAETGYGYLELSDSSDGSMVNVNRFIEKPDLKMAEKFVTSGNYLWNSGIFLFRASVMVDAFIKNAPNLISAVQNSIDNGKTDLGFFRLDPICWANCENISIDYAVMEKFDKLVAVPFRTHWSDLGDWSSVWAENMKDEKGNVNLGNSVSIDSNETFLRAESDNIQLVGLGLKDIIVIAMSDAVLVADKTRVQDVKQVVSELKNREISQAEFFPKFHRPWGWFEILSRKGRSQVKRIMVKPGGTLSLQSHKHRSEHWVVVEGTVKVIVGTEEKFLSEGESVYVPVGVVHRMENSGPCPMLLIEVQIGSYLEEDDIIRYDDIYSRD